MARCVTFVPVCPEKDCGLPVPRKPLRLVGDPMRPRLVIHETGQDETERLTAWAESRLFDLERENLSGFIFKSRSPSCGLSRVKVFGPDGRSVRQGAGLWASRFTGRFPRLPVADEVRLEDPGLRESFIQSVLVAKRWQALEAGPADPARLAEFHARHSLLLLAHSPDLYRRLGRLAAPSEKTPYSKLLADYGELLTQAMKLKTTAGKHARALRHAVGCLENQLGREEKVMLEELIRQYAEEGLPWLMPARQIRQHILNRGPRHLKDQHYLHPHPLESELENLG
jgi:uncharacterized protein YbgA (DUF1722 family)/uncharacterized protein YbbK (DUF523 family)